MTLNSRINAIERRILPMLTPVEQMLCQCEPFVSLLDTEGVDIEVLKANGNVLGALPPGMLRLIVERLKAFRGPNLNG